MLIKNLRFWAALAAILASANMVMKLWLIISAVLVKGEPVVAELLRFYSFFTHWVNLACCLIFAGLALPNSKLGKWAHTPGVRSALTVYMSIAALVYHALLADLWAPQGLTKVADIMFHTLVPAWVFLLWLLLGEPKKVPYRNVLAYLAFPFVYLVYSLIRGAFTGYYPYFFLNVGKLGYVSVGINALLLLLLLAFLSFGYLFTFFANVRHRGKQT
jgi:hypothetical protein